MPQLQWIKGRRGRGEEKPRRKIGPFGLRRSREKKSEAAPNIAYTVGCITATHGGTPLAYASAVCGGREEGRKNVTTF